MADYNGRIVGSRYLVRSDGTTESGGNNIYYYLCFIDWPSDISSDSDDRRFIFNFTPNARDNYTNVYAFHKKVTGIEGVEYEGSNIVETINWDSNAIESSSNLRYSGSGVTLENQDGSEEAYSRIYLLKNYTVNDYILVYEGQTKEITSDSIIRYEAPVDPGDVIVTPKYGDSSRLSIEGIVPNTSPLPAITIRRSSSANVDCNKIMLSNSGEQSLNAVQVFYHPVDTMPSSAKVEWTLGTPGGHIIASFVDGEFTDYLQAIKTDNYSPTIYAKNGADPDDTTLTCTITDPNGIRQTSTKTIPLYIGCGYGTFNFGGATDFSLALGNTSTLSPSGSSTGNMVISDRPSVASAVLQQDGSIVVSALDATKISDSNPTTTITYYDTDTYVSNASATYARLTVTVYDEREPIYVILPWGLPVSDAWGQQQSGNSVSTADIEKFNRVFLFNSGSGISSVVCRPILYSPIPTDPNLWYQQDLSIDDLNTNEDDYCSNISWTIESHRVGDGAAFHSNWGWYGGNNQPWRMFDLSSDSGSVLVTFSGTSHKTSQPVFISLIIHIIEASIVASETSIQRKTNVTLTADYSPNSIDWDDAEEPLQLIPPFRWDVSSRFNIISTSYPEYAYTTVRATLEGAVTSTSNRVRLCFGDGSAPISGTTGYTSDGRTIFSNINAPWSPAIDITKIPVTSVSLGSWQRGWGPGTNIVSRTDSSALYRNIERLCVATCSPDDADNRSVTWSSNNSSVVSVSQDGNFVNVSWGYTDGTAVITATSNDDSTKTASFTIIVKIPIDSIDITADGTSIESITIAPESTKQLGIAYTPAAVTYPGVTWESGDESIATVDAYGLVTAAANTGTVTITATANDDNSKTDSITVHVVQATGVSIRGNHRMAAGRYQHLTATVTPDSVIDKSVTWASSNDNIAIVDSSGRVTARRGGVVTITATSNANPNASGSFIITVYSVVFPDQGYQLNNYLGKAILVGTTGSKIFDAPTIYPSSENGILYEVVPANSTDPAIATVDGATHTLTGIRVGYGRLVALHPDFTDAGDTFPVLVVNLETDISSCNLELNTTAANKFVTIVPSLDTDPDTNPATHNPSKYFNLVGTDLTWASSNTDVATVDLNGTVTAEGKGSCTITCTHVPSGAVREVTINVIVRVTGITLDYPTTLDVNTGGRAGGAVYDYDERQTAIITATITPNNANWLDDSSLLVGWSSNASGTVSVSGIDKTSATVSAENKTPGTATITATADGVSTSCEITAVRRVTGISISDIDINQGNEATLSATFNPENPTEQGIEWSINRPEGSNAIATINQTTGKVTATNKGDTGSGDMIVTAKSYDGNWSDTATVHIVRHVQSIAIDNKADFELWHDYKAMQAGATEDVYAQSRTLTATITPPNCDDQAISWSSNHAEVAKVDSSSGKVTAVEEASTKATITVTTHENSATDSVLVNVAARIPTTSIQITNPSSYPDDSLDLKVGQDLSLSYSLFPADHTDTYLSTDKSDGTTAGMYWTSDHTNLATVSTALADNKGIVHGVYEGNDVRITGYYVKKDGQIGSDSRLIYVDCETPITGISVSPDPFVFRVTDDHTLTYTLTPSNHSDNSHTIAWVSDNPTNVGVQGSGSISNPTANIHGKECITSSSGIGSTRVHAVVTKVWRNTTYDAYSTVTVVPREVGGYMFLSQIGEHNHDNINWAERYYKIPHPLLVGHVPDPPSDKFTVAGGAVNNTTNTVSFNVSTPGTLDNSRNHQIGVIDVQYDGSHNEMFAKFWEEVSGWDSVSELKNRINNKTLYNYSIPGDYGIEGQAGGGRAQSVLDADVLYDSNPLGLNTKYNSVNETIKYGEIERSTIAFGVEDEIKRNYIIKRYVVNYVTSANLILTLDGNSTTVPMINSLHSTYQMSFPIPMNEARLEISSGILTSGLGNLYLKNDSLGYNWVSEIYSTEINNRYLSILSKGVFYPDILKITLSRPGQENLVVPITSSGLSDVLSTLSNDMVSQISVRYDLDNTNDDPTATITLTRQHPSNVIVDDMAADNQSLVLYNSDLSGVQNYIIESNIDEYLETEIPININFEPTSTIASRISNGSYSSNMSPSWPTIPYGNNTATANNVKVSVFKLRGNFISSDIDDSALAPNASLTDKNPNGYFGNENEDYIMYDSEDPAVWHSADFQIKSVDNGQYGSLITIPRNEDSEIATWVLDVKYLSGNSVISRVCHLFHQPDNLGAVTFRRVCLYSWGKAEVEFYTNIPYYNIQMAFDKEVLEDAIIIRKNGFDNVYVATFPIPENHNYLRPSDFTTYDNYLDALAPKHIIGVKNKHYTGKETNEIEVRQGVFSVGAVCSGNGTSESVISVYGDQIVGPYNINAYISDLSNPGFTLGFVWKEFRYSSGNETITVNYESNTSTEFGNVFVNSENLQINPYRDCPSNCFENITTKIMDEVSLDDSEHHYYRLKTIYKTNPGFIEREIAFNEFVDLDFHYPSVEELDAASGTYSFPSEDNVVVPRSSTLKGKLQIQYVKLAADIKDVGNDGNP